MDDSILNTVKSMLGSDDDYAPFDTDFIVLINSALAHLNDLGAGPVEPFSITGTSETWDDFTEDKFIKAKAKEFIYLDVKLKFDPPTSSFVLKSFEDMRKECEWRIERYTSEK